MGLRHLLIAATLVGVVTAGCADTSSAPDPSPSSSTPPTALGATSSPSAPASPPPSQPARPPATLPTVPAPGPRTGPLHSADLMVISQEALTATQVDAISALKGVTAVERLSVGQVPVENEIVDIAAVDPAGYRRFTELATADTGQIWARVAAGEAAVAPRFEKKLPIVDGTVKLGSQVDAASVRIGAWAPQLGTIDAVVNRAWAQPLGMAVDNALLISTGQTAPQGVRSPVQEIVGDAVSVQALDAVARFGLDPDVVQTAVPVGTVASVVGTFTYTVLDGGRIAPDPAWVREYVSTQSVPILGRVTCNKYVFPQLRAALEEVVQMGLADTINPGQYAGCYYPRFIAGSSTLSNHSFGLALDLNVPGNLRGTVGEMNREVVAIFKRWGFAWGGDWSYTDPMHFEMNRLVDPR